MFTKGFPGTREAIPLHAFALKPVAGSGPQDKAASWTWRYSAAILSVAAAFALRFALIPLVGHTELAFTIFLPAILFAAWLGGFGAGVLSVGLSAISGAYFMEPVGSLLVRNRKDEISLLVFIALGFGMVLLADSQKRAVERAVRAEGAERNERRRFETTLASIGDAVVATDGEGRITFANRVASSLLRAPEADLLGRHLDDVFRIVNESTRADVESPVARALREGGIAGLANHTVLIAQDGTELPIDDSAAPIHTEGGAAVGAVLVFRDITERRATEKLLAAQTGELRQKAQLLERVDCFVRDLEDRIVYWNSGAVDLYGFSADEAVGQVSHKLLKTVFPTPLEGIRAELMSAGCWDGELIQTRRHGDQVTVVSHWSVQRDENGQPTAILQVNVDVTDRKRVEEAQRQSELAARLLQIQEEERRRIGRELHDSAGQKLVMLKIHLDSLQSGSGPGEAQRVADCVRLADDLIKEVRTTSYALYPPMLEDIGLKSAISWYLDGFMQRSGIVTRLESPSDFVRPPRELELALFRVLQESLTNVFRHSGSPVANVRLDMKDGMIRLEVADQGKGIPAEVLDAFNRGSLSKLGVGLRGMKDRIRQLGGQLNVSSTAGGTVVSAAVPWREALPKNQTYRRDAAHAAADFAC